MSNKEKKQIMKSGTDANGAKYYYTCPKCGEKNALNDERCVKCNKKRPSDAYESAIIEEPQQNNANGMNFGYFDPFMSNAFGTGFPSYGPEIYGNYYGAPVQQEEPAAPAEEEKPAKPARKVKKASIFAIIFSILTLVVIIVPHFLTNDFVSYVQVISGKAGLTIILDTVKSVMDGNIVIMDLLMPAGLIILTVFTVLTLIFNLFSIKCRKYPIIDRVFAWLAVIGAILMMVMILVNMMAAIAYGSIIISGLCLLTALITLTGKRK